MIFVLEMWLWIFYGFLHSLNKKPHCILLTCIHLTATKQQQQQQIFFNIKHELYLNLFKMVIRQAKIIWIFPVVHTKIFIFKNVFLFHRFWIDCLSNRVFCCSLRTSCYVVQFSGKRFVCFEITNFFLLFLLNFKFIDVYFDYYTIFSILFWSTFRISHYWIFASTIKSTVSY